MPATDVTTVAGQTFSQSWSYQESTGFLTSETRYGITTTFTPDSFGNVATTTKANSKSTSYAYSWGQVAQTATPNVVTTRQINPDGTAAAETVAGRTTSFTYDGLGRVLTVQPPGANPTPHATTTTYDNVSGQSVTVTRGTSLTTTTLDGFGRPTRTENSVSVRTRTSYDAEGRVKYQSYPYSNGVGLGDIGTSFEYDGLGRVIRETNPGSPGTFGQHTYAGTTETITDEEGRATVLTRQAFGHRDDARLVGLRDANQQQWTYQYNALGSLVRVTAPDGTQRNWTYDNRNLLASETHPESGTVNYTSYDSAGVLKSKTDAKGTGFTYEHDDNDRLVRVTAGGQITSISYRPGSDERETVSAPQATTQFEYDAAGHLFSRNDAIDGQNFLTRFTYDASDNLKTITYTTGRRVAYEYDGENRLTAVYWITGLSVGADLQLGYSNYDRVGNVRTISDARPNMTQTFTYDALDRLASANGPYGSSTFNYDVHGNRTASNYTYWPNTFRLRSIDGGASQMTYDNNGNLLTGPQAQFTYTPNNLVSTAVVGPNSSQFTYDGDDWRVKKAVSGGATTYFVRGPNGQLLTEWEVGSPSVAKDYVYAGSRLVGIVKVPR